MLCQPCSLSGITSRTYYEVMTNIKDSYIMACKKFENQERAYEELVANWPEKVLVMHDYQWGKPVTPFARSSSRQAGGGESESATEKSQEESEAESVSHRLQVVLQVYIKLCVTVLPST